MRSELLILGEALAVCGGVDWVVRLVTASPSLAVFAEYDSLAGVGGIAAIAALRVEVLELDDAGVILVEVGIVHDWAALIIVDIDDFFLKVDTAPLELIELVIIEAVDRAGINREDAGVAKLLNLGVGEVIGLEANFELIATFGDDVLEPSSVAIDWETFVNILEVVIIIAIADGEALDHLGRELLSRSLPLLSGVILDEGIEKRAADERNALLGEIGRVGGSARGLILNLGASFLRRVGGMEELVNSAEVDWERVDFALVSSIDTVDIARKSGELIDIIPDFWNRCMEEVGAVFMAFDAGNGIDLGGAIAADMIAAVDQEDALAELADNALSHSETIEASANDENVGAIVRCGSFLSFTKHFPPLLP